MIQETANKLMFVRRVLYRLKQSYGYPVDLYRFTSSDINLATGRKDVRRTKYSISKAVILPASMARKFAYDLSYVAANKNFSYGAFYDVKTRLIIVDGIDLPVGFDILIDDHFVHGSKSYVVRTVESIIDSFGFLITAKETEGTLPFEVTSLHAVTNLNFNSGGYLHE